MIKEICTIPELLKTKSTECLFTDLEILNNRRIVADLLDTAEHLKNACVGLAANQIQEYKRIIVIKLKGEYVPMINPRFTPVSSAGIKQYKEGCLSHPDRKYRIRVRRYKQINLTYQLVTGEEVKIKLIANTSKIDAVIAQHEINHLNGILI